MGTVKVDVETDAYKLVKYVCGTNYQTEDGEGVEIKPDSEYPDWLWTLPTGTFYKSNRHLLGLCIAINLLSFLFFMKC